MSKQLNIDAYEPHTVNTNPAGTSPRSMEMIRRALRDLMRPLKGYRRAPDVVAVYCKGNDPHITGTNEYIIKCRFGFKTKVIVLEDDELREQVVNDLRDHGLFYPVIVADKEDDYFDTIRHLRRLIEKAISYFRHKMQRLNPHHEVPRARRTEQRIRPRYLTPRHMQAA